MKNIYINEAETIFAPFYDGGDSFRDHQKYSCLSEYTIDTHDAGMVTQTWWSAKVVVYGKQEQKKEQLNDILQLVSMVDTCQLDIQDFDIFRVFAIVSEDIRFKVICCVDGVDQEIICTTGYGVNKEYNGRICGRMITRIRLEFENLSDRDASSELIWMGLSNSAKEKSMLERKSQYDEQWEGCFVSEEESVLMPQLGLYFDEQGLIELRQKMQTPHFQCQMDYLRSQALEAMKICPEKEVGTFVHKQKTRRFVRERDVGRPCLPELMDKLAFVGLIDEDERMLRMACRMALAVAHCEYFCESIMGVLPGATWHHRSFSEETACKALIKVLDWAGGLLSWHGKNIIYDAIIMKGLPRLDADIKTMDYIWKMNQGPVFASCLAIVNIALSKRYPRYEIRVQEAEKNLLAMWENYTQSDGGTAEGPVYWQYTLHNILEALYLLSRHYGKTLEEYVPASVRKSSIFAYACLSDAGNYFVPVNDAECREEFRPDVLNFLAEMNVGDIWKQKSNFALEHPESIKEDIITFMIFGKWHEVKRTHWEKELTNLPVTGHTTLRRKTKDLGVVGLHMISGLITDGHAHADKGSFILEVAGTELCIDRGVCQYDNAFTSLIGKSEYHNLVTAVKNGQHMSQNIKDSGCSGVVTEAKVEEDAFSYTTDVTPCWEGLFEKNIRQLYSKDPYHYVIRDELQIKPEYEVCFVLNTYGEIREEAGNFVIEDDGTVLTVLTKNWQPDRVEYACYGTDGNGRPVNRLCLYIGGAGEYSLCTEITIQGRLE